MALDALPIGRGVRVPAGALALVDLYLRNQSNAALLQGVVSTWDWRVYAEQGASPETALYTELAKAASATNADGTAIILAAAAVTAQSRLAVGHTFLHKFDPVTLWSASPGQLYRLEYKFNLTAAGTGPVIVNVALAIDAAYQ